RRSWEDRRSTARLSQETSVTRPPLFEHQKLALQRLQDNPRYILDLDMGSGKTRTVLEALTDDHLRALVVATKRVAEHGGGPEQERWRHDLTLSVAAGSPAQRRRAIERQSDIAVIGRDNVADVVGARQWRSVNMDE